MMTNKWEKNKVKNNIIDRWKKHGEFKIMGGNSRLLVSEMKALYR